MELYLRKVDVLVYILLSVALIRNSRENKPSITICYQSFRYSNTSKQGNVISKYLKKLPRTGGI